MDLSVIIVSYNVKEYLNGCLTSVFRALEKIPSEVFVVDNSSTDGSAEMVQQNFPSATLICNNLNTGFAAACNQGINMSSGRYVLLLNPDTVVGEKAFSKCIEFMDRHPDAGAAGVKMTDGNGNFLPESKRALPLPLTAVFKITGLSYLFPRSPFINRYYLPQIDMDEISPAEVISGAFMFLRNEALLKAGLPDESFFMYGEDIDLSYRIMKAGYTNYYFPEVSIIHYKGRSTSRKEYTDIVHFYAAMRIYIRKRQKEKFSPLFFIFIPSIYARELLAIIIRFIRIIFSH